MSNISQSAAKGKPNPANLEEPSERLIRHLMQRYSLSRWLATTYAAHVWVPAREAR